MGNFSRNTFNRLKHYVSVRLQQGVPIVDADWNEMDDIRRYELQAFLKWFVRSGVPLGNDGFRIQYMEVNDNFRIRGGDGTPEGAGRCLVEGWDVIIESDTTYIDQPLYNNTTLATAWGVKPVPPLNVPTTARTDQVYLDVWEREVTAQDDFAHLVNPVIGMETSVRIKREWVVRVVEGGGDPAAVPGHIYYPLAELRRKAGDGAISTGTIIDLRDNDLGARREIVYRGANNAVEINTARFKTMLTQTRNNIHDFIESLIGDFMPPDSPYTAGEVLGMQALDAAATLADHGIALINARSLDTQGAFAFFEQLVEAEKRFVAVWKTSVLPLNKPLGKVYDTNFKSMILIIESLLTGPNPPSGFTPIAAALAQRNLTQAVLSQERLNTQFARQINLPSGSLFLAYAGPDEEEDIEPNQPFKLRYRISGRLNPADNLDFNVIIDPSDLAYRLSREDNQEPFAINFGPGDDKQDFFITIVAPDTVGAPITLQIEALSRSNSSGVATLSGETIFRVGDEPGSGDEDFAIRLQSTSVSPVNGVFQVPVSLANSSAPISFSVLNTTNSDKVINLGIEPPLGILTPTGWTIITDFGTEGHTIPRNGSYEFGFDFVPPNAVGRDLTFTMRALQPDDATKTLAQVQIRLTTISG